MKNTFRLTLLFTAVALLGEVTLRQLPEKILADLNHPAGPFANR